MLVAWLVERDVELSERKTRLGWIISLTSICSLELLKLTISSHFIDALYESIKRLIWAAFIAWIIYACHHLKSGGAFRRLLSLPMWQPIARMGLGIYLTHYVFIFLTVANMKHIANYDVSFMVVVTFGHIFVGIFLGSLMFLLVEAPVLRVVKYFE